MNKPISAKEVDAFMRQLKLLVVGALVLLAVPLVIYLFFLDHRIDSFEESQRYRPPHEVPEYAAGDTQLLLAKPVQGQTVYVPAYSHVYHGDGAPYLLTVTLSVRNTSVERAILVKSVRYFDTKGKEVKSYLEKPLRLPPLATTEFLVQRDDASGGSGANFLVEWDAPQRVSEPIIEAVMIDTEGNQGISFVRSGRVIREIQPSGGGDVDREPAKPPSAAKPVN